MRKKTGKTLYHLLVHIGTETLNRPILHSEYIELTTGDLHFIEDSSSGKVYEIAKVSTSEVGKTVLVLVQTGDEADKDTFRF